MGLGLGILLIIICVVVITCITVKIGKKALRIGKYDSKEFVVKKSSFKDWNSVLENPCNISMEILHTGDVTGKVYGMINLKGKEDLGIKNEKLIAPLFSHLIRHEKYGDFLVDTGFDSSFSEKPSGHFKGLLKSVFLKFHLEKGKGINEVLEKRNIDLKGVFCTHFHEHQGGAPALSNDLPFIYGKGEKDFNFFPLAYATLLKGKNDISAINFELAEEMPILGKAVDVFGDGSFWAISTPGHTEGHVSYFVNGLKGKYMITGDLCMCFKSFELGVESGRSYAKNPTKNKESFLKVKKFIETYPQVKPVFGHESEEFKITYGGISLA